MHKCEFCGSEIPENARFCGQCGRAQGNVIEALTGSSAFQLPNVQDLDAAKFFSISGNPTPKWHPNPHPSGTDMPFASSNEEEEEDDRRRYAALLEIPLFESLAEAQAYAGDVPMVQVTPQMNGVPTVQGTPQVEDLPPADVANLMPAGSMGQAPHSSPTIIAPHPLASSWAPHLPATTSKSHYLNHSQPRGCSPAILIAVLTTPILLILSFISLGLTVLAPGLSLSGSTYVVQGGTLSLHGHHYIPGSNVTLTLDDTRPLYITSLSSSLHPSYVPNSSIQSLDMGTQPAKQIPSSYNTVSVRGDGTFDVTIRASTSWPIGNHTIKATESVTHRSAELDITIYPPSTTPSPSSTETGSATPFPAITLTPSATITSAGLNCVSPTSLALGPVSQGYTLPVSATVTLCTIGAGTVNWTASWNQNEAPWLQLDFTSGQISAPGQAQLNVSALASNLAPGRYSTILTFSSQPNNMIESLPVSLIVQPGCVKGTPNALKYTGFANASDPTTQKVAITNCGVLGVWFANAHTTDGASWLFANPTGNTLNAGASASVAITASNLRAHLPAGIYTGTVTFRIGASSFIVGVTLSVVVAPVLSVTPTIISANQQCIPNPTGFYICFVSLTNTSTNLSLNWSATSSKLNGVNFKPASSTLLPEKTIRVEIAVPQSNCPAKGTLTFTGPGNTVNLALFC
jgi:Viral BACON domain